MDRIEINAKTGEAKVIQLTPEEEADAAARTAAEAIASIPKSVTMRQARLALLQSGLLSQVNAAVASADEATKITWDYSSEVHRNHPFVATLAAALNLSDSQLDGLFTLAASL